MENILGKRQSNEAKNDWLSCILPTKKSETADARMQRLMNDDINKTDKARRHVLMSRTLKSHSLSYPTPANFKVGCVLGRRQADQDHCGHHLTTSDGRTQG